MTLLINDLESKLAEKTIMNLFDDVVVEYFDGTGSDNQTNTLYYHAFSPLISVAVKNTKWDEKTEVTSLSSSDHVKFDPSSDDQLITWGDGTNGAKPPSGTNNIRIIYRKKETTVNLREIYNTLLAYTTTPLNAGDAYTSSSIDSSKLGRVTGTVYTDQNGILYIDQSPDGDNWDYSSDFNIVASTGLSFSVEITSPYVRMRVYNSSANNQTVLRAYIFGSVLK